MSHATHAWAMPRMIESGHVWMSHITYEWVMSCMNESCQVWMSHVIYERVISRINDSLHLWMSHVTYEWVMSHVNEACQIRMGHATCELVMVHMNESCHIWMSNVTYEWVDWCCFYYYLRNSLVALLEALCARIVFFGFVNMWFFWYIYIYICARSLTKPFFCLSHPGSCAWLSQCLLCANCTCVLVCVCLCMCMWKCVGKVTNI